jgi:hypothetical protein
VRGIRGLYREELKGQGQAIESTSLPSSKDLRRVKGSELPPDAGGSPLAYHAAWRSIQALYIAFSPSLDACLFCKRVVPIPAICRGRRVRERPVSRLNRGADSIRWSLRECRMRLCVLLIAIREYFSPNRSYRYVSTKHLPPIPD